MYTYRSPVQAACILQHLSSCRGPATADVRLQCGDGAVGGHRLVLAALSPMLRAVFGEDSWDEDIVIMLPDISVIQINKYFSDTYHSKDLEDNLEINKMLGHMKPKADVSSTSSPSPSRRRRELPVKSLTRPTGKTVFFSVKSVLKNVHCRYVLG